MPEAMSTPVSVTGDLPPVDLFSPVPPSSVLVAVGLAEVASLEASLPASEPMTLQRVPPLLATDTLLPFTENCVGDLL